MNDINELQSNLLTKFVAKGNSLYLYFGDVVFKFDNDILDNHSFKTNKEYSKEFIKELIDENNEIEIKKYISKKYSNNKYSKYEIRLRVNKKFFYVDENIVQNILDDFEYKKIIDDKEFAIKQAKKYSSMCYGKYYILHILRLKNVDSKILQEFEFDDKDEFKKANEYYLSVTNKYISKNFIKTKAKIVKSLVERGFSLDIANKVVNTIKTSANELDILKKEYLKLKKKYGSKKVKDKCITDKVITKLVSKGFKYNDILKIKEELGD